MKKIKLTENEILVLRTCKSDYTSTNNFKYPKKGKVVAPDWNNKSTCGGGLHGLPWGIGGYHFGHNDETLIWQLIKVNTTKDYLLLFGDEDLTDECEFKEEKVDLIDECKFKEGEVVFSGNKKECLDILVQHAPKNLGVNYLIQEGNNHSTQTAGDFSTQKADNNSTQKAGKFSVQEAGNYSIQIAGIGSVQIGRWYDGNEWKVATRALTEKEADKPYLFKDGVWTELK